MTREPFLIESLRRDPTGDLKHTRTNGGALGTSARGFLAEFDAHIAALTARAETAEATVQRVEAVMREHWDWKAGWALRDAVRAALDTALAPAQTEHHPNCYQSTGRIPDDLPSDLCDCRVLRMIDEHQAAVSAQTEGDES